MPTEVEPKAVHGASIRVLLSPVCELQFALCGIQRLGEPASKWKPAWAATFVREHADLRRRVDEFWEDDPVPEWGELLLLAHHAGIVFEDTLESAWDRLSRAAAEGIIVPPLPVEEPEVRPLLQARIDRLSRSPELRERYLALVREVWQALEPEWRASGLAAAEWMAQQIRQQLAKGPGFRKVLPPHHFVSREPYADIAADAAERGALVIVPLGLGGGGIALSALPDLVVAAFGPDAAQRVTQLRETAARAATSFKLFSDPTRCAILVALIEGERNVTDLAAGLGLSQPTVSVHVKALREAGLLESRKLHGQTRYTASPERIRTTLTEATHALLGESPR